MYISIESNPVTLRSRSNVFEIGFIFRESHACMWYDYLFEYGEKHTIGYVSYCSELICGRERLVSRCNKQRNGHLSTYEGAHDSVTDDLKSFWQCRGLSSISCLTSEHTPSVWWNAARACQCASSIPESQRDGVREGESESSEE